MINTNYIVTEKGKQVQEFTDVNMAMDFIFMEMATKGNSLNDYKIIDASTMKKEQTATESVKGTPESFGVQMTIFDFPGCECECEKDEGEGIVSEEEKVEVRFALDARAVKSAVEALFNVIADHDLSYSIADGEICISLEDIITDNVKVVEK